MNMAVPPECSSAFNICKGMSALVDTGSVIARPPRLPNVLYQTLPRQCSRDHYRAMSLSRAADTVFPGHFISGAKARLRRNLRPIPDIAPYPFSSRISRLSYMSRGVA
jgi:hypothetical protein